MGLVCDFAGCCGSCFRHYLLVQKTHVANPSDYFQHILLIGYYATLVTFIFMLKEESMTFSPSWTVCLPLVAIILNWLAIRAIGKDEVLVKAYDRLR